MAVEDFQVFSWYSVHCVIQSTTVYGVLRTSCICMLASHSENNRQWKVNCNTNGTDRLHLRHLYCGGKSAAQTLKQSKKI